MVDELSQSTDDVEKIIAEDQHLGQKHKKKLTKKHHKNQHRAEKALKDERISYLTQKKQVLEKEHKHLKSKETKHKKKLDQHMEQIAKQAFVKVMAPPNKSAFDNMERNQLVEKSSENQTGKKHKKHKKKHHTMPQSLVEKEEKKPAAKEEKPAEKKPEAKPADKKAAEAKVETKKLQIPSDNKSDA